MKIYHKIQNKFFQIFDFSHIKENRKNGCDIIFILQSFEVLPPIWGSENVKRNSNFQNDCRKVIYSFKRSSRRVEKEYIIFCLVIWL